MARAAKPPIDPDDAPLKRLGGGRWQTRDERFTIEPQSGTWVIVDAEQTDDFGMALVRGPFPSLTAAKEAISTARSSDPATSPLAERIERRRGASSDEAGASRSTKAGSGRTAAARAAKPDETDATSTTAEPPSAASARSRKPADSDEPGRDRPKAATASKPSPAADEAPEPAWIDDLAAAQRGRARRLIARLRGAGVTDAEGLVRRDLVGGVPALASLAIGQVLDRLGPDAKPRAVADALADGHDEDLGARWRLVDGDGRPILLDPSARRRR